VLLHLLFLFPVRLNALFLQASEQYIDRALVGMNQSLQWPHSIVWTSVGAPHSNIAERGTLKYFATLIISFIVAPHRPLMIASIRCMGIPTSVQNMSFMVPAVCCDDKKVLAFDFMDIGFGC
jgi:hypothetical protein